jgi:hypothetical protein
MRRRRTVTDTVRLVKILRCRQYGPDNSVEAMQCATAKCGAITLPSAVREFVLDRAPFDVSFVVCVTAEFKFYKKAINSITPCEIRPYTFYELRVFDILHSNCTADWEQDAVSSFLTSVLGLLPAI